MIAIVDYGMGNVGAIANMLRYLGAATAITSQAEKLRAANGLILPGVGSFDTGMRNLEERGLAALLSHLVLDKGKPILGICLGMQLLGRASEEGQRRGLGWVAATSRRFRLSDPTLRVPHMGWNQVRPRCEHHLWRDLGEGTRFYFVHSYHVICDHEEDLLAETDHGGWFTSAVAHKNILGVQFHPEKSHKFGMQLLRNFSEVVCQ